MVPYAKVSSSRFQVDLQQSHFSILNSTSSRLRQVNPTPLDLRSSSRPKSTYWGRLPGLVGRYRFCPRDRVASRASVDDYFQDKLTKIISGKWTIRPTYSTTYSNQRSDDAIQTLITILIETLLPNIYFFTLFVIICRPTGMRSVIRVWPLN